MTFYICQQSGETCGVFYKISEAKSYLRKNGGGTISVASVTVCSETIRLLLNNAGGYANYFRYVCEVNAE